MDVNVTHTDFGTGKTAVSAEMAQAVREMLDWYGQNQAGLASFSGLSASTISGVLRIAEANTPQPKPIRTSTWNDLVEGLQKMMQSSSPTSDIPSDRMRSHRQLLRIAQTKLSIPGDALDGNFSNYIRRTSDSQLETRIENGTSRLMSTIGGHKLGHTSFLRETGRHAEDSGFDVKHVNLEVDLAFNPEWDENYFWETLAESLSINPPPADSSDIKRAVHLADTLQSDKQFIFIDGIARTIMTSEEERAEIQLRFLCQLPLVLGRAVAHAQSKGRSLLILLSGPFPFFETKLGNAFHQSRVQLTQHKLGFFDRGQCASLFKSIMSTEASEGDLDVLSNVLSGHPYLVHAALDGLKRSGTSLPTDAKGFCNSDACLSLVRQCETSFRALEPFFENRELSMKARLQEASKGSEKDRNLCLELGLAHFHPVKGYQTIPVIEAHYEDGREQNGV